jgi:phosphoribosyl 1,2-cyclic phosphodiesterase
VELRVNDTLFILDMGSGIRMLGKKLMGEVFGKGQGVAHILMSHTHWDHLEGFPFFVPAYVPGNQLHFHTPYDDMEDRLRHLMNPPYFPVDLDYPQSTRTYEVFEVGKSYDINGVQIELCPLKHPGTSYAYRFTHNGKVFVYATDAEYPKADQAHTSMYEDFFRDADALFFDAMYTYEDAVSSKVDWGHSTAKVGADLAWRANVKRLLLTHHDPDSTEQQLWAKVDDADQHLRVRNARDAEDQRFVEVLLAHEGLTIEL